MPLAERTERMMLTDLKKLFIAEGLEIRDWCLQRAFFSGSTIESRNDLQLTGRIAEENYIVT